MSATLQPALTPLAELDVRLAAAGFAVLDAGSVACLGELAPAALQRWAGVWNELPLDTHLRDGGRYRRRRHGCFVVDVGRDAAHAVERAPHRAHWQPLGYNALHGGLQRWFEPLPDWMADDPAWAGLLRGLAGAASALRGQQPWFVEAHPFRIDTTDGIGRPTPEGAHRDGVDLVAVLLVERHNVKGGETRVFDAAGANGTRFTMTQPWSALILDDARVIHESTPIQPLDATRPGWRDTLVVTLRGGSFQDPDEADTTE